MLWRTDDPRQVEQGSSLADPRLVGQGFSLAIKINKLKDLLYIATGITKRD